MANTPKIQAIPQKAPHPAHPAVTMAIAEPSIDTSYTRLIFIAHGSRLRDQQAHLCIRQLVGLAL